jgi:hypothetical protein
MFYYYTQREPEKRNLLLVKMKEKNLLKIQPLPKVLRMQIIRSKQLRNIYLLHTPEGVGTRDDDSESR